MTKRTTIIIIAVLILTGAWYYTRNYAPQSLFGDRIHKSIWDGSLSVAEKFLKDNLNATDGYRSISWGDLINNQDGTYTIKHTYQFEEYSGQISTRTVTFIVSADGDKILAYEDNVGYHLTEENSLENYRWKYYKESNFSGHEFNGTLTKYFDEIVEIASLSGKLSKDGKNIKGELYCPEKKMTLRLDGSTKFGEVLRTEIIERGQDIDYIPDLKLAYRQLSGRYQGLSWEHTTFTIDVRENYWKYRTNIHEVTVKTFHITVYKDVELTQPDGSLAVGEQIQFVNANPRDEHGGYLAVNRIYRNGKPYYINSDSCNVNFETKEIKR